MPRIFLLVLLCLVVTLAGWPVAASRDGGNGPIVKFGGVVEVRPDPGSTGAWVIGGQQVQVVASTEFVEDKGPAKVGATVVVLARKVPDADPVAFLIRVAEPAGWAEAVIIKGFVETLGILEMVVHGLTIR